ncbi:PspA/IM30 family protein [Paenibacillus sp. B01]|uniref:PspA/IM30 family protein n=1 Tax=Paenibacillus sp. B01 TaxID=2660554 RepID=UPI00129BD708|nr:PspA/IM30 family protein [Paenibacillus sp. B01]QGG55772.1 PspA/IM30 family protein [Paenibacillus sp. B01]
MSLFKRLRDLTLSNVYALIDKAEDPVKMTDQYIRDMASDLEEAEKAVAAQIALEKKFKKLLEEQEELLQRRLQLAHAAAEAGNVDLARRALAEKQSAEAKRDEYRAAFETNKASADLLRDKLAQMQKQLGELKSKRESLVARAQAAKAQVEINRSMSGFGSDTAMAGLKRMEDKVLGLESQAEASNVLNDRAKSLDEEFEALGRDKKVEDELAALLNQYKKPE